MMNNQEPFIMHRVSGATRKTPNRGLALQMIWNYIYRILGSESKKYDMRSMVQDIESRSKWHQLHSGLHELYIEKITKTYIETYRQPSNLKGN